MIPSWILLLVIVLISPFTLMGFMYLSYGLISVTNRVHYYLTHKQWPPHPYEINIRKLQLEAETAVETRRNLESELHEERQRTQQLEQELASIFNRLIEQER